MAQFAHGQGQSAEAGPPKKSGERRSHDRHAVEGVHGVFLSIVEARVVNLSLDGVAVETHHYLQVGREYSLKLSRGVDTSSVLGKVAWCSLVGTTRDRQQDVLPIYRAGIQFQKVLSDSASELRQLLEENAIISLEKRLFGRFKTKSEKAADVVYEARFAVQKISQAGMRIQTDIVPELESVVELEMQLDGKLFRGSGRIVHARRLEAEEEERPLVEVGIQFVELNAASRRTVDEFIANRLA